MLKIEKINLDNEKKLNHRNNLYEQKIKNIRNKIIEISDKIDNIQSKEILNRIETELSNIHSNIIYIEPVINSLNNLELNDTKKIERLKSNYVDVNINYVQVQNKFVSKKLELTKQEINDNLIESEQKVNELTQNMLFSIASIFLGISLTSALVAGIELIPKELLIMYFATGGLIAIAVLGIGTVIIRNYDAKSKIILKIFIIYTIIWSIIAGMSYKTYDSNKEIEKEINIQINKD